MFQHSSQKTAIIRCVSLNCGTFINLSLQIQSVTLTGTSNEIILKQTHSNTLKPLAMGQIFKTELSVPKLGFQTIVLLVYNLILQYKVGQQSWTYFSSLFSFVIIFIIFFTIPTTKMLQKPYIILQLVSLYTNI